MLMEHTVYTMPTIKIIIIIRLTIRLRTRFKIIIANYNEREKKYIFFTITDSFFAPHLYLLDSEARFFDISVTSIKR